MAHQFYRARQSGPGYDKARANTTDKLSGAVLDEIKKQKDAKGDNSKNFGEFDEAPGGGTPAKGGGRGAMKKNFVVADSPKDPEAIEAKEKGEPVRYMQPRNEDGTFTYNSANGKSLSTSKSRGKTDIPWLAGVDLTFLKKGAVFSLDKDGGKVERLLSGITLSAEELHDALSIYLEDERGFAGIVGGAITKKGRTSNVEKDKIQTGEKGKINQLGDKQLDNMSANRKNELDTADNSVERISNVDPSKLSKNTGYLYRRGKGTGGKTGGVTGSNGGGLTGTGSGSNNSPQVDTSNSFDKNLLNSDPNRFMAENKEAIDKADQAIQNNPGLKSLGLTAMDLLGADDINSFDDLMKAIEGFE